MRRNPFGAFLFSIARLFGSPFVRQPDPLGYLSGPFELRQLGAVKEVKFWETDRLGDLHLTYDDRLRAFV